MVPAEMEIKNVRDFARLLKPQSVVPIAWCIVLFFVCFPACMLMFITPGAMSARSFNNALRSLQNGDNEKAVTQLRLSLRLNPKNDAARSLFVTLLGELDRSGEAHDFLTTWCTRSTQETGAHCDT